MPTLEEQINYQEELINNLKSSEKNYKKSPKDRIKQPYLETRLDVLEQQFKEFQCGHKAIVAKASRDRTEAYFTQGKYEEFEELYVQYKSLLREGLRPYFQKLIQASTSNQATSGANERTACDIQLPRIVLPIYSGKYEEWQTFYDMFTSLIHANQNITAVQKMHYLKSNLTGEALSLLSNFSTTDANYEDAWKQLIHRYNNKRYNCNVVMKKLFSIKKIYSESANGVRLLLDTTSTCLKSLQNMSISTSSWDAFIVYLVISKLDTESIKLWEQYLNTLDDDLPTWNQLREFLEYRFRSLEMIDTNMSRPVPPAKPITRTKTFHTAVENKVKTGEFQCSLCQDNHQIYHCKTFSSMTPKERQEFVQNSRLCFNCLLPTHSVIKCRQPLSCRKCGKRHHTLLHFEREIKETNQEVRITSEGETSSSSAISSHEKRNTARGETHITAAFSRGTLPPISVLLATARVKVFNSTGCKQFVRALLDQGSMASFITESTVQLLGLTRKPVCGFVSGLGDGRMRIKSAVSLRVESRHNPASSVNVCAYVLHSLTSLLPATKLSVPVWKDIGDLPLADPSYSTPGKIDILLGADVYGDILIEGMMKQPEGSLMAQNTIFGWILSGRVLSVSETDLNSKLTSMHIQIQEDDQLKMFWEIENEPNLIERELTKSEQRCEEFFNETTVRDHDGRLVVRLPFRTEDPKCQYGNTRAIAIKRLEILERKLLREPKLRDEYNKVMQEYLSLNHMRRVTESELEKPNAVYLPHHAIVREDKETSKVRVVYDASSRGDNNISLNDELLVGPKL